MGWPRRIRTSALVAFLLNIACNLMLFYFFFQNHIKAPYFYFGLFVLNFYFAGYYVAKKRLPSKIKAES
jgi:hypothetical protein